MPSAPSLETPGTSLPRIGLWHRRVLRNLLDRHQPEHVLLLYFDHAQLALASRVSVPGHTGVSGILFRPTLHYPSDAALGGKLRQWRKTSLLSLALRHRRMERLYCLDPTAVQQIRDLSKDVPILSLPDPVPALHGPRDDAAYRARYRIDARRQIGLLFGALAERKGVLETLRAAALLPQHLARAFALVMVGEVEADLLPRLHPLMERAREAGVQIILDDRFVADEEIPSLLAGADVVLLPYQHHVGSSGVLIRAAQAGRPVIAQDVGLIAHHVNTHGLGLCVDTTRPDAIAAAIGQFVEGDGLASFNAQQAAAFAAQNGIEPFLDTLLAPFEGGHRS